VREGLGWLGVKMDVRVVVVVVRGSLAGISGRWRAWEGWKRSFRNLGSIINGQWSEPGTSHGQGQRAVSLREFLWTV
jgi:hypothetical protein